MIKNETVVIIGGGAAGFFTAINVKINNPNLQVIILEQTKEVLSKVKISGGGRCNVTNSIWSPKELADQYPRGKKELLGPMHRFGCADTMEWFENHGVKLKIEEDGRVFPQSDTSQTIVNCFYQLCKKYDIEIITQQKVKSIEIYEDSYKIVCNTDAYKCNYVVVAAGSSKFMWDMCQTMGYDIISPVPSLFTFNIRDERINDLMGITSPNTQVKIINTNLTSTGPLLITHWGMSGPAILKCSAWGAIDLHALQYKFDVSIDWNINLKGEDLLKYKNENGAKNVMANAIGLPSRLWRSLVSYCGITDEMRWGDMGKAKIELLTKEIKSGVYRVDGKSTFKEEFVTAGGIDLKQINFQNFESKLHPNIFFAGEILNIDAITGGFNFQAAWTAGYLIASSIAERTV